MSDNLNLAPAVVRSGALPDSIKVEPLTCAIGAELSNVNLGVASRDPDLVAEIRSPKDRVGDMHIKVGKYLNAGVTVVLVIDPDTESVAVFRADALPQRFSNGDELTLPDVFPGFVVPVRTFFEPSNPNTGETR